MFINNYKRYKLCRSTELLNFFFYSWCVNNDLTTNIDKCNSITFSTNFMPPLSVSTLNDVGAIFSSNLLFKNYVDAICNKSLKLLGFVNRNITYFSNTQAFLTICMSLVRFILDYAFMIWLS